MADVNEVLYPSELDTVDNFPDVEIVTQDTYVEINRNRDAILKIEEVLGVNPHIGAFTEDPSTSTVSQRISILEEGMASGRYQMNEINVANALIVKNEAGVTDLFLGRNRTDTEGYGPYVGNVKSTVRGTLEVLDISTFREQVLVYSDRNIITATSIVSDLGGRAIDPQTGVFDYASIFTQTNIENNAIVTIQDQNPKFAEDRDLNTDESLQHLALWVVGNVQIDGILKIGELALNHSAIQQIDTTPVIGGSVTAADAIVRYIHVKWGDWHSHVKKPGSFDRTSASPHWQVDPTIHHYGILDHKDLVGIHTNSQTQDTIDVIGFTPVAGVAYHVTGGDNHDHNPAGTFGGAQIDHSFLSNIGSDSGHISNGNLHDHTKGAGAGINHNDLINRGFYSHTEIDASIKEGNQTTNYLDQLVGGAQVDEYNINDQLVRRQIFKDQAKTTLLEKHDFEYDATYTAFMKKITRTIYDAQFGSNLVKNVIYTLLNDGTHYTSITWTPATEV